MVDFSDMLKSLAAKIDAKPRIEWRPDWAPHVVGSYTEREYDEETRLPEPQHVVAACETCGATWQTMCMSGSVRSHITRFASVHLHRDPFNSPIPGRGG